MDPIKLLFMGDLAPVGIAEEKHGCPSALKIDSGLLDVLNNSDLRIANLECPLTETTNKATKTGPHLKAHPDSIKTLERLKINVVCLSNNHISDYGDQGVLDTIERCNKYSINTVGAGENISKASDPLYIEIKGKVVALLNFSESEFNTADEKHAGSNPDDPINIWQSLRKAKGKSDYQIVIMHGGKELHQFPTPYQIKLFHFIADQGVCAIIGHHTHVIGVFEIYNNTPVIYSLGNFIFDEKGNPPEWYQGAIVKLTIEQNADISVNFYKVSFENSTIKINDGIREEYLPDQLEEQKSIEAWKRKVEVETIPNIKYLLTLNLWGKVLLKFRIFPKGKNIRYLLSLCNTIRCKTHSDFTTDVIKNYTNNLLK